MDSSSRRPGWVAFQHRDFRLYCVARFLSALALQMQNVAIGWRVYDLTRDPLALGIVGLVAFLPAISLALVTGHVADRVDRRAILIVCYAAASASAAGLLFCVWYDVQAVWPIYVLTLVLGTTRAFANPASQALVPNLVPPEHFANAVAWNSTAWQTATIAGPAVGGILYALGPAIVFEASTGCFLLVLGLFVIIRHRTAVRPPERASWSTLLAGLRFVWDRKVILGAISLDLFAVLLGGATALLPIFARDILQVGPWGLGLLRSMPAVGAACTALVLAYRPLTRHTGRRMFEAVAIFGVATVAFGLSRDLALSLFSLFVMGAADMVSVFVRQTLVQLETPDAMRGRVSAVNSVFIGASNELGEFESGALAAAIGTVPTVVVGGIGTLLVAGIWSLIFPDLRRRDRLAGEAPPR
jgi:MFS family permease